jgi:hypothetical protein
MEDHHHDHAAVHNKTNTQVVKFVEFVRLLTTLTTLTTLRVVLYIHNYVTYTPLKHLL